MIKNIFNTGLILILGLFSNQLGPKSISTVYDDNINVVEKNFIDSIYAQMTLEERVGQLFMIRAHSDKSRDYEKTVEKYITKYNVGGLCFFQGTAQRQVELINEYQAVAKYPLMISMDAEWGPAMRFKEGVVNYPRQLLLGAIQDNTHIYDFGREVAKQMKAIGVHVNFAPVVDINNNPANPVINDRSFGEDRVNVLSKGQMYASGMQDGGIMAVAKHFPGHGDTDADSHYDLPVIKWDTSRLFQQEVFPFQHMVGNGVQGIMVAHLNVPAFDSTPKLPTTLSRKVITDLLKNKLGFKGLVYTDAMEMQGVLKHFKTGVAEVMTLQAGTDVVLMPANIGIAYDAVLEAVKNKEIDPLEFEIKVKKILLHKKRLGVFDFKPLDAEAAKEILISESAKMIKKDLIREALTLVRDEYNYLPLKKKEGLKLASITIGSNTGKVFRQTLNEYAEFQHFTYGTSLGEGEIKHMVEQTAGKELVIVSVNKMGRSMKTNWGVDKSVVQLVNTLQENGRKVCVVLNGNPYAAGLFDNASCLVVTYVEDIDAETTLPAAIFGAEPFRGKMPVTASTKAVFGQGKNTQSLIRLTKGTAIEVGAADSVIAEIDSMAHALIEDGAAPGCVILVAKEGKVFYHKAFGHHTYAKERPMDVEDIFDVASITKIASTTLAVMKLYDSGLIDIKDRVSKYLPELQGTNKSRMTIGEVMSHRAGLAAYIPFYKMTLVKEDGQVFPSNFYYNQTPSDSFSIHVADQLYMKNTYVDEMWRQIIDSPVNNRKRYLYSDLGMYMMASLVEKLTGKTLDEYVREEFYEPMGLEQIGYLPLTKFPTDRIVPTEDDDYYRKQVIKGHVHDMGAAMLGGVSGHAGLFSDAFGIAALLEMVRNGGYYNGMRFFDEETVAFFTKRFNGETRRGLGFDMRQMDKSKTLNVAESASSRLFGHTGFTGTCAWVDPDKDMVFVFLSNRTFPSMNNRKLITNNYRNKIMESVYQAFQKFEEQTATAVMLPSN